MIYDEELELSQEDARDGFTGQPRSKWCSRDPEESRAVFVDENTCIGCKQCVWAAQGVFRMEAEYGRSQARLGAGQPNPAKAAHAAAAPTATPRLAGPPQVFGQWLNDEEQLQTAVEACPARCPSLAPGVPTVSWRYSRAQLGPQP